MREFIAKSTHPAFRDLEGLRFGRLTVVGPVAKKWRNYVWFCRCDCGAEADVKSGELIGGGTKSCGCYKVDNTSSIFTTHGHTAGTNRKGSRAYRAWCDAKTRVTNHNRDSAHRYVGRGITMCDRWFNSFELFLEDMGSPPKGVTLERIDNDGNYCPENCRWATRTEQAANTEKNRYVAIDGEQIPVSAAARKCGISPYTVYGRLNRGVPETAVFTKDRSRGRYVNIDGEKMSVVEAEKRFGTNRNTIYSRLDRGCTDFEAVFGVLK